MTLLEPVNCDLKKIVFADECTRTGGNIHELFLRGKLKKNGHLKMSHVLHFQEKL